METTVDFKNLDECIKICKDMTADNQYKFEKTKNPALKRAAKNSLQFWGSTVYYLELVEAMTDDEVLQVEDRIKSKKGGENAS